jgi:hypothetical protein
VDNAGNAYVTGNTSSPFPTTPNAFQPTPSSGPSVNAAYLAKLNAAGNDLLYSTYLDGNGIDTGQGIAVEGVGNAYVVGITASTAGIPPGATPSVFQPAFGGGTFDAYVAKIDTTQAGAASLRYFTYLGGNSNDFGEGIYVDKTCTANCVAYVTGRTESPNFTTTPGAYDTSCGTDGNCNGSSGNKRDVLVAKLNPAGAGAVDLVYSTYLGGGDTDFS